MRPALKRITADPEKVKKISWKQYGVRFLFGGIISAVVGIIGKAYGPAVAGLFLAFPAILPASLTLISEHEGERAAGVDAVGAQLGSFAMVAFGIAIWGLASGAPAWLVLLVAMIAWIVVAIAAWPVYELVRHKLHSVDHPSPQHLESDNQRWGVAKR